MKEFIESAKKWFKDGVLKIKEGFKGSYFLVGLGIGITLTRIIVGNNVIGAIVAGVVISFIIGIGYKIFKKW